MLAVDEVDVPVADCNCIGASHGYDSRHQGIFTADGASTDHLCQIHSMKCIISHIVDPNSINAALVPAVPAAVVPIISMVSTNTTRRNSDRCDDRSDARKTRSDDNSSC